MQIRIRRASRALAGYCALVAMLTAGAASVRAHHSFSAFDMGQEASVAGTVRQVDWTNPHIWIWVDVKNDQGGIDTYGFEAMSPNYLARRGWKRNTMKPGDEITVVYRPLKSGDNGGMFVSTTLPSGQTLQMFGSPVANR